MFRTAFAAVSVISLCEPAHASWENLISEETQTKQLDYFFRPPSYNTSDSDPVEGDKSDSKRNFQEICAENGF